MDRNLQQKTIRGENTVSTALRNATPPTIADIGKEKTRTVPHIFVLIIYNQ